MGLLGSFILDISTTLLFHGKFHAKHACGGTFMLFFDRLRSNLHKTMINTGALHVIKGDYLKMNKDSSSHIY